MFCASMLTHVYTVGSPQQGNDGKSQLDQQYYFFSYPCIKPYTWRGVSRDRAKDGIKGAEFACAHNWFTASQPMRSVESGSTYICDMKDLVKRGNLMQTFRLSAQLANTSSAFDRTCLLRTDVTAVLVHYLHEAGV